MSSYGWPGLKSEKYSDTISGSIPVQSSPTILNLIDLLTEDDCLTAARIGSKLGLTINR